ncbi:MAG: hypothetical protein IJ232_03440 [Lachnospiraceae bacterium]|nr:hypothetical protein [Lachnospiraceae bacterium]
MNLMVCGIICVLVLSVMAVRVFKKNKTSLSVIFCLIGTMALLGGLSMREATMWRSFCIALIVAGVLLWGMGVGLFLHKK